MGEINADLSQFTELTQIGEGSFATIFKARWINENCDVALKRISKRRLISNNKVADAFTEKAVLNRMRSEHVVRLYGTFSDDDYIYFILELCVCDLFQLLGQLGRLDLEAVRRVALELIGCLDALRADGIVHRDIKPENVFLAADGRVKLGDFATARAMTEDVRAGPDRTPTFVGTPQYVCPEALDDQEQTYSSDLWSVGCIIYQLIAGTRPFVADSEYLLFEEISGVRYSFPPDWPDPDAEDLVTRLLVRDPTSRLGADDLADLRHHPFLANVDSTAGVLPKADLDALAAGMEALRSAMFDGSDVSDADQLDLWESDGIGDREGPGLPQTVIDRVAAANSPGGGILPFLFDGEHVMMTGDILKRKSIKPLRRRRLILTDYPRLLYIDIRAVPANQKGEVPWSAALRVRYVSAKKFEVAVPARVYAFRSIDGEARLWADMIQAAISAVGDG